MRPEQPGFRPVRGDVENPQDHALDLAGWRTIALSPVPSAPKPDADMNIGQGLARSLLRAQHPEFAEMRLEFADEGWDNSIFRLGTERAVRLPRRQSAHTLLLGEQRWLPFLAPRLPLDVPVPLHRGKPGSGYPYHWAIVPWLPGPSAARVPAYIRDGYAGELAAFMRAMHVPAPADAPRNPVRGVPLRERDRTMRTRLETLEPAERAALTAIWERGLSEREYDGPRLWLHGDPHPHNLFMKGSADTTTAELSAVIDFGDLASDVAFAWLHFTESGRKVLFEQLSGHRLYPPGTWNRARAWAVGHAVLMARLPPGDPLHAVGVHGIGQLLA